MPDIDRIYIFQLGDRPFFAYSVDKTGASIPRRPADCWMLRGTIASLEIELDTDRMLEIRKAIAIDGYCFLGRSKERTPSRA